jgi:hypothetical protein
MGDVAFLALPERRLRLGPGVGATVDDVEDRRAEAPADLGPDRLGVTLRILDGVVQQGTDRLVLVRPVFEGDARHAQDVRDIGDGRALADIAPVQAGCEHESVFEAGCERHWSPPPVRGYSACRGCGAARRLLILGGLLATVNSSACPYWTATTASASSLRVYGDVLTAKVTPSGDRCELLVDRIEV